MLELSLFCRARRRTSHWLPVLSVLLVVSLAGFAQAAATGPEPIRIAGIMDLLDESKGVGESIKAGVAAALRDQTVAGRALAYQAVNDFFDPETTALVASRLIEDDIFAMLGNMGAPTARRIMPLLAESQTPAIGFVTGASFLRHPGIGPVLNYRATYVQEIAHLIRSALGAGVQPDQICAFVQNDGFGMAGLVGIRQALVGLPDMRDVLFRLEDIVKLSGANPPRNNIGPVGVYQRNTRLVRDGFRSLDYWENDRGTACRLVVTVGSYRNIASFAAYARYQNKDWVVSAVSFAGAENLTTELREYDITDKILMTQVTPPLDSPLPIVAAARDALGPDLNYLSLEGFIVGKLFLAILEQMEPPLDPRQLVPTALGRRFDLGGLELDFRDDNQGSDLVSITVLTPDGFVPADPGALQALFE